jgi:hypothetical protein
LTDPDQSRLLDLMRLIAFGETGPALRLLTVSPALATASMTTGASRNGPDGFYLDAIGRYVYAGHTALHVAAGAYQTEVTDTLLSLGADVRARNRRGAEPLHEAALGEPGSAHWHPDAQAATINRLIAAGAAVNAQDRDGAAPLHRAVRTRCAAAVKALLDGGVDPQLKTKSGSTPLKLASLTTGRGGTGSAAAKDEQAAILSLLEQS